LRWRLARIPHVQSSPTAFTDADFTKLRNSGIDIFHPAVAFEQGSGYDVTRAWFAKWNRFIEWHPDYFVRVNGPNDLALARQQGLQKRIGIILGMQDAIICAAWRLQSQPRQEIHSLRSRCDRAHELSRHGDRRPHCGQRTSIDVISASKKPVLITHSNCRALAPGVARCKPDEVIRAAARTGGVLGITAVRQFVRNAGNAIIDDVLNHFDHAAKLAGVEHVGLGSDFDLDAHPSYDIPGLNNPDRIYQLTDGLLRRGYTDAQVSMMLGGNFELALRRIWLY